MTIYSPSHDAAYYSMTCWYSLQSGEWVARASAGGKTVTAAGPTTLAAIEAALDSLAAETEWTHEETTA